MKRVEILYGGEMYSIGDRDYEGVRDEIAAALDAGRGWLRVNLGAGTVTPADLLLTSGVSIAVVATEDPL